jgi:zinc/manganese transport system substrate-binding protein
MSLTRRMAMLLALAAVPPTAHAAETKMPVVASFSILGDVVKQIGGDRIAVTTLVGPDGDAHVFEPGPADAQSVARARVLVVNGLGFEGWMDRLEEAAGFRGIKVVASEGVTPREMAEDHHAIDEAAAEEEADHHDGLDPHAWQDVANVETYARNIAAALERADPEGAPVYRRNAEAYLAALSGLEGEVRSTLDGLPADHRTIVTSHDAFGYYAAAYDLTFLAPEGISTEAEASAADVAALIRQIRSDEVRAVFVENITDARLLDQIGRETEARIGGTLFSDALSPPDGPAATYLDLMRHNTRTLAAALQS